MLEIHLLGQFSIRIDGRELPYSSIEGRKARSLLKLLALQRNHQLVRDRAMDILWPSLAPDSAAAQLYKAIHHIRKAFSAGIQDESAEELIEISDELVRLAGSVATDVERFEAASRKSLESKQRHDLEYAASLYTGDLLPMDLYSKWSSLAREHLSQLYLDVLLALGARYQSIGRLAHAAETYRLALQKDPLLETTHRSLMRVFALQGQTKRAIRQYEQCRTILRDELDAEPEPATVQLRAAIAEKRIAGPASEAESVPPLSLPVLVNRVDECRIFEAALDGLAGGQGGGIVIEGAAGVGKSRLANELTARGRRRGFSVLTGRGREFEGAVAYGPIIEFFRAAVRERPELDELIPHEIARAMPGRTGDPEPVPNTDRKAAQGYLFARIHEFLRTASASLPTIVVIEDLHAADEGTFELLHFLWRRTSEMPVLIAATIRNDLVESTDRVRALSSAFERESHVKALRLQPLGEREHLVLLEQISGRPDLPTEFVDSVYRLSEGNPFLAVELYHYHAGDGRFEALPVDVVSVSPADQPRVPPSLVGTVDHRLKDLSAGSRHLLYLMAVLGRETDLGVLETAWRGGEAAASAGGEPALFDLLEELESAGLIEEHGLTFSFRHAIVRASVYESISEARRIALHKLAARSLLGMYPDEDATPVEQVAFHFARAGDARQAAHYLTLAGKRAENVYAHEDALRCYTDALEMLEGEDDSVIRRTRSRLYRRIGDVYRASGRLEQSSDAYEHALELATSLHLSRSVRADLHMMIALVAIFRTEMPRSEMHLATAEELVESDVKGRARVLILKALHFWHLNRLEEAYETARKALALAESIGEAHVASQACEILAMACLPMGRWEEGLEYEKRRQIHGWSPDVVIATDAHLCLWEYHVAGDRPFEEALTFMQRVSEQAEALGDYRCVAVCHYALGTMYLWRGDSERAEEELEASLALHNRVGSPAGMAYSLARKAVMHTLDGALDAGWDAVQAGIEQAHQASVRDHCLQRLYGVGLWNRLEANDADNVGMLVTACEDLIDETQPCSACALELYPWLAYHYIHTGEIDRAETCSHATSNFAEATGNPVARVISMMVRSSVMAARTDYSTAGDLRNRTLRAVDEMVVQQARSPVMHFVDRMIDQQNRFR